MAEYDPDEFFHHKQQKKLTDCADCVTRNCMFRNRSADDVCRWFTPKKPTTNADRIRGMSNEELAVLLEGCICPSEPCKKVVNRERQPDKKMCQSCWLDWLKQEVEDGDPD